MSGHVIDAEGIECIGSHEHGQAGDAYCHHAHHDHAGDGKALNGNITDIPDITEQVPRKTGEYKAA